MFRRGSIVIDEPCPLVFRIKQVVTDALYGAQALFRALVGHEADGEVGEFSHRGVP